ncbi:MAG: hypothetical protein ACKV0T_21625 [Planctomycetales bacterium]
MKDVWTRPVEDAVSAGVDNQSPARWMRAVLWAAACYNLAWGAAVIFFPVATLEIMHFPPQPTPQLWQCIGMIVGVYGVGYGLAARDPYRLWPMVVVGLLGKILGPLGFLDSALHGTLPWSAGWTIVTNDLIWWLPFGVILAQAWHSSKHSRSDTPIPPTAPGELDVIDHVAVPVTVDRSSQPGLVAHPTQKTERGEQVIAP